MAVRLEHERRAEQVGCLREVQGAGGEMAGTGQTTAIATAALVATAGPVIWEMRPAEQVIQVVHHTTALAEVQPVQGARAAAAASFSS